jgi:exosortase
MENPPAPSSPSPALDRPAPTPGEVLASTLRWIRQQPLAALLALTSLGTLVFFYGFLHFVNHNRDSIAAWTWQSWNQESNMQHGVLVPLIFLGLLWYHRQRLASVQPGSYAGGWWMLGSGVLIYLAAYCTAQPRLSLFALPVLLLGSAWFLWGRRMAAVLLFPCAFLLFSINTGFIENTTFRLQFLITSTVSFLANLIGIHTFTVGTTISAMDDSFNFDIVGGCSGIRSLFAMAMLTSIYVHVFQHELWKKFVIFAASLLFAVVGNVCRIFTIILVARYISKDFASGLYHDYSDFVFFPCALGAMVGFGKLLNLHFPKTLLTASTKPGKPPVNYDY